MSDSQFGTGVKQKLPQGENHGEHEKHPSYLEYSRAPGNHTVDIAPTMSLLVGAKPPTGAIGAPLNEVIE